MENKKAGTVRGYRDIEQKKQEKELRTLLREFRSWMKIENILLEYVEQHGGQALEEAIQGLQK